MARLFRDLKVEEADGKIRLNLYNRDGSAALTDVSVEISSEIVQQGDRWSAAAANCLLEIGEDGQPRLALTPEDIGAAGEQDGVNLYTHKRTGTQHTLTGTGNNIRFAATADFAAGDTFLVNGTICAAKTAAGDALWSGFFKSGAVVVCWRSGNNLTFNTGGLPGPQAAKLTPENIKSGVSVEVNGKKVDGIFTKDGNAAAGDMRAGKTAYVNGVKVTGTLASRDTGTPNWCQWVRVLNNRFEVAPPEGIHGCYWDGGQYSYLNFDQVRDAIGLTSEKLAEGQQVLGIWGTYCGKKPLLGFSIDQGENLDRSYTVPVAGQYTVALNFRGRDNDGSGGYYAEILLNGSYIKRASSGTEVNVNWVETFYCNPGDVIRVRYSGYFPSRYAHVVYKTQ